MDLERLEEIQQGMLENDKAFFAVPETERNLPKVDKIRDRFIELQDEAEKLVSPENPPRGFNYGHPGKTYVDKRGHLLPNARETVAYAVRILPSTYTPVEAWGKVVPLDDDLKGNLAKLGVEFYGEFLQRLGEKSPLVRYAGRREFLIAPKGKETTFKNWYKRSGIKGQTKESLPSGLAIKRVKGGYEVVHTKSGNRLMPFAYPEKELATDFARRAGQVGVDWTRPFPELQKESEKIADLIRGGKKPGMFEKVLDMPTTFPKSPSRKPLKDMTKTELKKLRVILHILPDGTMEIKEKGADSLERGVASWNPPNRPDATEKSWVGGYIMNENVADNAKKWLDMVAKKYDLDMDEIVADSWRGGGMMHKESPYRSVTNTFTGKVKTVGGSKVATKERPNLSNVVGLHPDNKSWRNFLKDAELREEKNGIKHYISSNGHYIVLPDGEVITFYGYHGQNVFNKIVADKAGWLRERDKAEKELDELLHPDDSWMTDAKKYHSQLGKLAGTFNARMKRLGPNGSDLEKERITKQFRVAQNKLEGKFSAKLTGIRLSAEQKAELRKISEQAADAGEKAIDTGVVAKPKQEVRLVSPAADLQWSEPKAKLEKITDEFRKHYGKKVTIYGGGGAPPSTATLQRVEIHPTILKGKDGYTLKAFVKGADSKILPADKGGEWDFWLGSWQIAVNPKLAVREKTKPVESSLQAIHDSRSPRSRESDERQSNADTIEPDDPRVERWLRDQGRLDVVGIDTPRKGKDKKVARKVRKSTRTETQVRGIRK